MHDESPKNRKMKIRAIKYRVIDKDGNTCCVIAVRKFLSREFDPKITAETFANRLEHPRHKDAIVQLWKEDEFDFSEAETVRLVAYTK